jgi:pyridoxal phosphate enzyme (YggS family)
MIDESALSERIANVRARTEAACARADRDPASVTLIAVSKTHPPELIAEAWRCGLTDFGENRVQEGASKVAALATDKVSPRWHLIGHLQTNKAAEAVRHFDILHGVDTERLASAISERASTQGRVRVLVEVNVAGEQSKFGVPPDQALALCERVGALPHIELLGLMTVAPIVDDPADARPIFRTLRELRDAAGLRELSMGMTDDFEQAIEEGSTMVRVGRAIFGERGAP